VTNSQLGGGVWRRLALRRDSHFGQVERGATERTDSQLRQFRRQEATTAPLSSRVRLARTFRMTKSWHVGQSVDGSYAAAVVAAPFTNVSRSALIVSASVVGMPCGKPL
jgi:hypothetical protein